MPCNSLQETPFEIWHIGCVTTKFTQSLPHALYELCIQTVIPPFSTRLQEMNHCGICRTMRWCGAAVAAVRGPVMPAALNANSARFHTILLIATAGQPFNFAPSREITRFMCQETDPLSQFQISPPSPLRPVSSWPRPSLSSRARPCRWNCPRRPLPKVP